MSDTLLVYVCDAVDDLQDRALDDVVTAPEERPPGNIRKQIAAFAKIEDEEVQAILDEGAVNREDVVMPRGCSMEFGLMLEELCDIKQLALACAAVG